MQKIVALLKREGHIAPHREIAKFHDLLWALHEDAGPSFICFDTECIYGPDDYKSIIEIFARASGSSNHFEILATHFEEDDQTAGIRIRVNGKEFAGDWEQPSDWVSEEFCNIIQQFEKVLKGRLVDWPQGQEYTAFYVEDESLAKEMAELFHDYYGEDE